MAENAKKTNKNLIIGICAGVAVVVAIVIAVLLIAKPGGMFGGGLNDDYFKTDDTKMVMTLNQDESSFSDEEYAPLKTHTVYYRSGETITGVSTFYEYADDATAKKAYDHVNDSDTTGAKEVKLRGKYIEIVLSEEVYEGTTAEEVQQSIEFMEMLRQMDFEDGQDDDVIDFTDDDEDYVEEDEELLDEELTEEE